MMLIIPQQTSILNFTATVQFQITVTPCIAYIVKIQMHYIYIYADNLSITERESEVAKADDH